MEKLDLLFHFITVSISISCYQFYLSALSSGSKSASDTLDIGHTEKMAYDQFVLFGDSLFQHSNSQERGYALTPALQSGKKVQTAGNRETVNT